MSNTAYYLFALLAVCSMMAAAFGLGYFVGAAVYGGL